MFKVLIFIVWSCLTYFLLQGKHSNPYYLLYVNSITKIGFAWLFYSFVRKIKTNECGEVVKISAKWFVCSFTIVMLYVFLPKQPVIMDTCKYIMNGYFVCVGFYSFCLTVYFIFCKNDNLMV